MEPLSTLYGQHAVTDPSAPTPASKSGRGAASPLLIDSQVAPHHLAFLLKVS